MVLCSSHTPQGPLWVIWAIGCGGFMPLEPPSVLLQGFGPFCLGTLFARFGLWIATNMATAGPKHPQEFPWASGGAGWQWGAAKPMSGPSRAHETAISPGGQMAAGVFFTRLWSAEARRAKSQPWPNGTRDKKEKDSCHLAAQRAIWRFHVLWRCLTWVWLHPTAIPHP